jgi:protein-L-isoaspartate(D-aspartate) O-methyltransferase
MNEISMHRINELRLEDRRRLYAEEIQAVAHISTPGLVDALAAVPREGFLPPGPWQIPFADPDRFGELLYRDTENADPKHVYHNVLVALDPSRQLNNGHPSSLCAWIDLLDIRPGARVFHLGCGGGYYTAIIAEIVGPTGFITAAEIDPRLAEIARQGLSGRPNVQMHAEDGMSINPGPVDAILVNAGVTHPEHMWLEQLRPQGRILMPLTFTAPGATTGSGIMILIRRRGGEYLVKATGSVAIFAAEGTRTPELNARLATTLPQGGWRKLATVRRDPHIADDSCWHHVEGACLSTKTSTEIF